MATPMTNNDRMPRCILEKEFERKRAYDIMRRMDAEQYCLSICEWGATGFASIAGLAMTNQNAESLADFLDDGGCEALVHIMNKFAETSVTVAAFGCLTVCILAWSLRELKEFLGEIGAGEVVIFATSMHIGDPLVSEFGTRAIGLLAKQNISNSYRLAQAGACDALAQAGNFGFNLRHERAVDVASNVCLAFSELAEAVNATRLMDCGACALVVELTKYHHKHVDFARSGMRAICALASLNIQHREELGRCEVCPLVVKMVCLHTAQTSLLLEGCEAIMHLSLSPSNANRLGACGGCEVVCHLLQTKLQDVDFGAEVCTGAMLNLSLYGEDAHRNRMKLVQAHVIELLRKTQFSPRASYKARENIVTLMDMLMSDMDILEPPSSDSVANNNNGQYNRSVHTNANPYHYQHASGQKHPARHMAQYHQGSSSELPFDHTNHNNIKEKAKLVSIIHGSEMKGDTVPLKVEVREVVEYSSFVPFTENGSHGHRKIQSIQQAHNSQSINNNNNIIISANSNGVIPQRRPSSPDVSESDPFVKKQVMDDEDHVEVADMRDSFSGMNTAATAIMNTIFTQNNRTEASHVKYPATVVEL